VCREATQEEKWRKEWDSMIMEISKKLEIVLKDPSLLPGDRVK
jgi:hypothetical protein